MSSEYVNREEFESLKQEVHELKSEVKSEFLKSNEFLQKIDKKIDVIFERFDNSSKLNELQAANINSTIDGKIKPLEKDIEDNREKIKDIKDNNKWLWRTVSAVIIGIVIKVVFDMV